MPANPQGIQRQISERVPTASLLPQKRQKSRSYWLKLAPCWRSYSVLEVLEGVVGAALACEVAILAAISQAVGAGGVLAANRSEARKRRLQPTGLQPLPALPPFRELAI